MATQLLRKQGGTRLTPVRGHSPDPDQPHRPMPGWSPQRGVRRGHRQKLTAAYTGLKKITGDNPGSAMSGKPRGGRP